MKKWAGMVILPTIILKPQSISKGLYCQDRKEI